MLILNGLAGSRVPLDEEVVRRGQLLHGAGFSALDALHVSCAEKSGAEVMLTTDDKLVRRSETAKVLVKIRIANPINWLMEVF